MMNKHYTMPIKDVTEPTNVEIRAQQIAASSVNRATLCGLVAQRESSIKGLKATIKAIGGLEKWSCKGVMAGTLPDKANDFNWIYVGELEALLKQERENEKQ